MFKPDHLIIYERANEGEAKWLKRILQKHQNRCECSVEDGF